MRKLQILLLACSIIGTPTLAAPHDGSHDFDFNFGTWHSHIRRYINALSPAPRLLEMDGTVTVRSMWDGKAVLEEIEADGPDGRWEAMTLFLYNPISGQWSQTFANSKVGVLQPPLIGEFRNGRGELFAQDVVGGRSILIRGVWSNITSGGHTYTESYSGDGGSTWRPAFIGILTKLPPGRLAR